MARRINGVALRTTRDLLGISRRELGRRAGVNGATISHLELGNHGASPQVMRKLADALGVPLDAITIPVPDPANGNGEDGA